MKQVFRLWTSLEVIPAHAGVLRRWHAVLADEFDLVKGFLRPTDRVAHAIPSLSPGGYGPSWEVVAHGSEDFVAICPNTRAQQAISKADVIVWELDAGRFHRELAHACAAEGQVSIINESATHLGSLRDGRALFLVCVGDAQQAILGRPEFLWTK